jgi:thiol-disulfide isomerase/thioredoxin
MLRSILAATVVVLVGAAAGTAGDVLKVGDAAPNLEVKEFVKGDKVAGLEKGKTYVIEFWATWCGFCRTAIPHLTKLQKKYKDVVFIGVNAYEDDQKVVKPFVEKMGDKMAYRVALDVVPDGGKGTDGKMAQAWMGAAGKDGIPTAFIVNGEGKIVWIGHPNGLKEPLEQLAAGKYDLKSASAAYKRTLILKQIRRPLAKAGRAGNTEAIIEIVDAAIDVDAKMEEILGVLKFEALAAHDSDADKARKYGKGLVEDALKNDAASLKELAWSIVKPEADKKRAARFVKLALQAAQRADDLEQGKDAASADTLARAYFVSGDAAKAIAAQERAIKLAKGTPLEKDKSLAERLDEYKKAGKK